MPLTSNLLSDFFYNVDTISSQRKKNIYNLNQALERLKKAKEEIVKKDIGKIIEDLVKASNLQQVQEDLDEAIANAGIALKNANSPTVKNHVATALTEINTQKIDKEWIEAAAKIRPQIEKSIKDAIIQIENAERELNKAKKSIRRAES